MIHFPDHSHIAGDFLTTIFDTAPLAVKSFQVVQKEDYNLLIRHVPGSPDCEEVIKQVCADLQKKVSFSSIKVSAEAVSQITHDKGKNRFIISELKDKI